MQVELCVVLHSCRQKSNDGECGNNGNGVIYGHFKQDIEFIWQQIGQLCRILVQLSSPYRQLKSAKNHSVTSYLLNKINVLFEMPVYDPIAEITITHVQPGLLVMHRFPLYSGADPGFWSRRPTEF